MDEMETTLDSLPLDILRNIFLRLPVESLGSLAGSCNLFEQFITKDTDLVSYFRKKATPLVDVAVYGKEMSLKSQHISHETILSKFKNLKFSNPFCLDETLVLAGSCNGLICFYQSSPESFGEYNQKNIWEHPLLNQSAEGTEYHYRIYIWNPTLHQIRTLPKLIGAMDFIAFGYDKNNEDYKILWISRGKRNKVEVYSWKNKSWKMICKNFRYVPDGFTERSHIVYFEGSLHWVSGIKKSDSCIISVFNIAHERLDVISVPKNVPGSKMMGVFKGQLSLLVDHEIWSREKSGTNHSWIVTYRFYNHHYSLEPYWGYPRELTANGKMLIAGSGGKLVLVDPETKSSEPLKLEIVPQNYSSTARLFFIDYVESLNSVYPPRAPQVM